jgi:flavin-dependent dehydrogenase
MDSSGLGPLSGRSRAVVIGGGPGGSATAIALKQGARALGRDLRVTLIEGKQFVGEQHHNQCVGVLSHTIMDLIERDLQVPFPRWLVRGYIKGYVLHSNNRQITLNDDSEPSIALRRVQFDAYMLNAARERGVEIVSARATGLEFHAGRVVVYTENLPVEASVVVGAFGLDEGTGVLFSRTVGYRPPPALSSIVTKYHPNGEEFDCTGSYIHAFLPCHSRIEFGGITPKGNHLTINIAGSRVDSSVMDAFFHTPEFRKVIPCLNAPNPFDKAELRFFRGTFPCGLAKNYAGDRFVMVGDASGLVRAFKGKGVTSAIQTGQRAANTILLHGISAQAFKAYHLANRDITDDMPYGRAMRFFTILASQTGLMDVVLEAAEKNENLRDALFQAVSAHKPYRTVIAKALSLASVQAVTGTLVRSRKVLADG